MMFFVYFIAIFCTLLLFIACYSDYITSKLSYEADPKASLKAKYKLVVSFIMALAYAYIFFKI